MVNPAYNKRKEDPPIWKGPRKGDGFDFWILEDETREKVQLILDAMDWPQLIFFGYNGTGRVVAPFVLGVSSDGIPLLRGYQIEGESVSGKGPGWRVFKVENMVALENQEDFFDPSGFDFDGYYPWIYKVFKMLETSKGVEREI